MKISIKEEQVSFEDGQGHVVFMTTEQLIEIVKIINISITSEGDFRFNFLEFVV